MTPRMCLPSSAWTDWRPKSAARAQSLSTGWRPTMPSARTRSEPRSKRIREPFLEREPFRYLPDNLPGPVEVPLEFRQANDLGREAAAGALRADPILIVDLIEADRDDVRTDLVEDRVDVPLVPEERTVHRFEALDHLDAGRLG